MLKSLFIQNYALIDTLDIRFEPGFSVITGETGAGKSIILGAIGLLLGQRADSKAIKNGAPKCVIEATFDLSAYGMEDFFTRNDLEFDGKECIVRREITAAGKSRAFINDTPASVAQLKELGEMLIDVHSQHQNLLLNKENFQLKVIDILARDKEELQRYKECYSTYKAAEKTLRQAQQEAEKAREEEDYLAFQLEQLDNAALKNGEQEELEKEQELLSHAEEIKQVLYQTGQMLDNDRNGILDALKEARHLLEGLAKALSLRFYANLNRDGVEIDGNTLIYRVKECRVQSARSRKGMPFHPCRPVGLIEYSGFAKEIDDRITCECLSCYPEVTDDTCSCAWRFTLHE